MTDKATQCQRLLALLRERGSQGVTPLDALNTIGSYRLAARVWDLRAAGHNIETKPFYTSGGATVARYVLQDELTLGLT